MKCLLDYALVTILLLYPGRNVASKHEKIFLTSEILFCSLLPPADAFFLSSTHSCALNTKKVIERTGKKIKTDPSHLHRD